MNPNELKKGQKYTDALRISADLAGLLEFIGFDSDSDKYEFYRIRPSNGKRWYPVYISEDSIKEYVRPSKAN